MTVIRAICWVSVASVLMSGCAATNFDTYYRKGVSESRSQRDRATCDVEANQLFPAANFPANQPTGYLSAGTWGWGLGVSMVQTQDVNAGMRNQHRVQCMTIKGYTPLSVPYCTSQQLSGANYAPVKPSATPSGNICAARLDGGGVVVVDLDKPLI